MKVLLLSIKPEYAERILNGTKKFEYRKRMAKKDVDVIYIYSSAPERKVVASVEILDRLSASPTALWDETKKSSGISRAKYREYFCGRKIAYAYKLGAVQVFNAAKDLADFGLKSAPQSFAYIDVENI